MLLIRLFIAFGGLLLILNASPVFANAQSAIKSYWAGNYSAAFEEFLPLARNGDLVSQRYLGDMYSLGQGLEQDFAKAMTWYQFSSDQGDEWAQYELGKIYEVGEGVPIDKKKALKWYRESADQGNYFAQFRLGYMFEIGGGVPEDKAEAVRWYLLSADQGYAWAQLSLGAMYRNGEGVSVDKAEAIKWYRASAKQGNALAQYALGEMYRNGGGVDEDKAEAIKWYSASAKQGNAWAQYALGEMYRNGEGVGEDKAEAIKWYKASSKQGNAWAQYDLGEMYRNGEGVDEDKAEAMKWYRLSADQGNEFSQYHLGDMYRNGEGVSEDIINAIKWYYLAAEQGSNEAHFQLGLLYFDGRGVPEDKSKAFKFFHNAAKEGHDISQAMLATQYLKGEGITKNIGLSKSWAQKSADQNNLGGLWVLGEISLVEEQFLVAEMQFEIALKTDENLKFSNPILFALISDSLGRLKQDLGKISEAKKIIEDVLEVKKDLYGKNSNDYVRSLNILAGLNFDRRQFEKAGRLFSEGIDLIDNNVDGEISLKIELLHNLGLLYAAQERLDLARDYINSAISLYESSELSGSLSLAQIFNTQAVISIRMRDLASAKEYLNNAMNFLEENAKETDTIYLAIKTNLAIIFEGEGNHQLAKLAFEEILKHANSYGYQNKYSANAHFNLGRINSVLGHYDEAEKHLQKTLEIQRVVYGSDSLNLATTHLALFTTYMSQGKIEASYKHGKYAVNIFDRMFALRISSNISNALAQKNFFVGHLSTISIMATDESFKSLYNDSVSIAFRSSQIVKLSAAGYSLAQLAMRSTFDNGGLSDLVRLQQDLQKELEYQVLMRDDIHATSTKKTVAGTSKINDVEIIKKKLTHVENKINKQFPKFSKYTVMQTMDISDLQNLLRDGEALFTNTPNKYDDTNTVFFITRDGVHTYQTGMKTSEIQKTVLNLRRGLDLSGSFSIESFPEFDLRLSYKLYNSIFLSL